MSIWDFIHTNPRANSAGLDGLYANYQLPFLVEVRDQLKFWIEENYINSNAYLDADIPEHYSTIYTLLHAFIQQIDDEVDKLRQENQAHALIQKLRQASNVMKNELAFPQRVQILYKGIRRILNIENGFVQQLQQQPRLSIDVQSPSVGSSTSGTDTAPPNVSPQNVSPAFAQIGAICLELKMEADNSTQIMKCIHQKQTEVAESYCLQKTLEEVIKRPIENGHTKTEEARKQLEEVKSSWQSKYDALNYFVRDFVAKNRRLLIRSSNLLNETIQPELINRKREAITWTTNLIDILQGHFADLAEVLWRCRLQLDELGGLYPNMNELSNLKIQFTELSWKVERLALLIETQPCQVIKKGTKFTAKVRFLAGSRNMLSNVSYGNVTASFLTKAEVRKLVRFDTESKIIECKSGNGVNEVVPGPSRGTSGRTTKTHPAIRRATKPSASPSSETLELKNENGQIIALEIGGEIVNNVEPLQTDDASFSATFQTSKIENIFKRDREPGKSVLDLEYWILFHTTVTETFNGVPQQRWVWAVSNPIKVHTHADQRAHAFETIIWLNAMDPEMLFSDGPRPKQLPWPNMARALNSKCIEMTKIPLKPEQLDVLKEKAFSVPVKNGYVPTDHLTFNQFCKTDFSPEYKFTFWRWYYEILKLIAKHLCGSDGKNGPWQDGHIAGFISRVEAERRLMLDGTVGSFLLRFSDSALGGISIVGLQHNGVSCSPFAIAPATNEDLLKRPLAERILDVVPLTHLYPNKPKADIFTPYLQKKDSPPNSNALHRQYVKTFLQTVVTLPGDPKTGRGGPTPSPRSSVVSSLVQHTPPATPATPYPFLMSNESKAGSCSPSSSSGFSHLDEASSMYAAAQDDVLNQLKRMYPSEASPAANDDFARDLENFLDEYVHVMDMNMDSQDRSSDEEMSNSGMIDGEFESEDL